MLSSSSNANSRTYGFTIVELLIVIVVVGILASIGVVAFQGTQKNAVNSSHYDEAHKWERLFMTYASLNGRYPDLPNRKYCLGEDFPTGVNGESRCQNYKDSTQLYDPVNGGNNIKQSESSALLAELYTVSSKLPNNDRKAIGSIVGPWILYSGQQTGGKIFQTFYNTGTGCPNGMLLDYTGTSSLVCTLQLPSL